MLTTLCTNLIDVAPSVDEALGDGDGTNGSGSVQRNTIDSAVNIDLGVTEERPNYFQVAFVAGNPQRSVAILVRQVDVAAYTECSHQKQHNAAVTYGSGKGLAVNWRLLRQCREPDLIYVGNDFS